MTKRINITGAELDNMKVLWDQGSAGMAEIIADLPGNRNTLKTLFRRLLHKGAIISQEKKSRNSIYQAAVSQANYTNQARQSFMDRVFDGSAEQMLFSFVKEEGISAEKLKQLAELIEED